MVEEAVMESVAALRNNNVERSHFVTASDGIWATHKLERLGGRATNVCERVIYIVTGERYEYVPVTPESKLSEYDS